MRPSTAICILAVCGLFSSARVEAFFFSFGKSLKDIPDDQPIDPHLLKGEYKKLNSLMASLDAPEDPIEAVKFVRDLTEKKSLESSVNKRALDQFVSLLKLVDPEDCHCDNIGHTILRNNLISAGRNLMVLDDALGTRRQIDDIIREIGIQHVSECNEEYPDAFRKLRATVMSTRLYRDLDQLMKMILETSGSAYNLVGRFQIDPQYYQTELAKGIGNLRGMEQSLAILEYIKKRTLLADPDYKYLNRVSDRVKNFWSVNRKKVSMIFDKYALNVCRQVLMETEPVLRPAYLEHIMVDKEMQIKPADTNKAELLLWMQYYRLCDSMVADRHTILGNILNAIRNDDDDV